MCVDLKIPESSSSVSKRFSLNERISDVLTPFDLQPPKHFDDENGLSQEELDKITEHSAIKKYKKEQQDQVKYGGTMNKPPRRNIKRKKS